MTLPRLYIEAPQVAPYRYGLFGATQERSLDDPHWIFAGVEWESLASYSAGVYPLGCVTNGGLGGAKTLDPHAAIGTAFPFAAYAGVDCSGIGYEQAYYEQRAREIVELGGQYAAEHALWTGAGSNAPKLNAAGTTDVTSGTATELVKALGLLENWLADHYNGVGNIHAKRNVGNLASFKRQVKIDPENSKQLITPLGTRWVFGGGYDGTGPNAVAPGANKTWIYATPQVFIARGDVVAPADFGAALNRSTNQEFLYAEQPYIIGVDGSWAAAQIDLTL